MRKLFLGVILCMLSTIGTLIGFGILCGWLLFSMPAHSQQRPQQQLNCMPVAGISADLYQLPIQGKDSGYRWLLVRYSTGRLLIGFLTPAGDFCIVDEGQENPRT